MPWWFWFFPAGILALMPSIPLIGKALKKHGRE